MGTTRDGGSQQSMWVATSDLPQGGGHPFYERLNQILGAAGFDAFVEKLCAPFYARMGRPSLAPGRYFRLLSLETHEAVFTWVLQQLADAGLVRGKTVGIDATTLEANAALRSIVRRDTGEDYTAFLTRLAEASGISTPTRAELARFDKSRKSKKKTSNADWTHPHDPDARVTKMKDGRTHLAHKAEHAADLETGAVVGVTVQAADTGDTTSMIETLIMAAEQLEVVQPDGAGLKEVVGDKGYHSNRTLTDLKALGLRSYISEPDRGRRCWKGRSKARDAVYGNRRRIRGARGRRLLRCRGELLERPFAHVCETGGMRRVHLRDHPNILKRLLVQFAGCNLGLLLRQLIGVGTPRSLQGRAAAVFCALFRWWDGLWGYLRRASRRSPSRFRPIPPRHRAITASAHACERGDFYLGLLDGALAGDRPRAGLPAGPSSLAIWISSVCMRAPSTFCSVTVAVLRTILGTGTHPRCPWHRRVHLAATSHVPNNASKAWFTDLKTDLEDRPGPDLARPRR